MNKLVKVSMVAALLLGSSAGANADEFIPSNISATLERHLAAQMQEMLKTAQQELSLSLQAQLSESLFDSNMEASMIAAEEDTSVDKQVVNSALVKE
ncbi:hypothetical protein LZP69_00060 [Shewanella sp. AS1]|uniref:hypothetical protein n=1 Tax=Shewanella sp. AS1 TaxID=2907626 RepID=UPI001F4862EC|nr:hypothetical protein [Shewanella sp. AS1]MCE9677587.1 hypothetical protein [Shewanella sp. AS1]